MEIPEFPITCIFKLKSYIESYGLVGTRPFNRQSIR